MRTRPNLTLAATGIALIAAIVQFTVPSAVPLLQRTAGALEAGQWWRLVTPLLVQTLGWYHVVTNLVTLALVGVVAERELGRGRWLLLFAAGTVGGQIAAYAEQEPGGGDSIAICGLAGGTVVWLLTRPGQANRLNAAVLAGYIAALTGWGFLGIRAAAVGAVAAAAAVYFSRRLALAGTILCAVALAAVADLHGVSLLSGMATGLVIATVGTRPQGRGDARRDRHSPHLEW